MEKERFFSAGWSTTGTPMRLNWEQLQQPMDQNTHFESALSSLVSSPTSNPPTGAGDSVVIMELIGRLDSICDSGDVSPTPRYRSSNTSCYSTPINSPPKPNISMVEQQQGRANGSPILRNAMHGGHFFSPFFSDLAFADKAVRYSCFGGRSYGDLAAQFGLPETGKLSRVSSGQSLKALDSPSQLAVPVHDSREMSTLDAEQLEMEMGSKLGSRMSGASTPEETEMGSRMEESPAAASDKIVARDGKSCLKGGIDNNNKNDITRKRKAAPKSKAKEAPLASSVSTPKTRERENSDAKRWKPTEITGAEKDDTGKPKAEQTGKDNNAKHPETPKDYIHVRARRGQATDSHSLAERVRREKISERMKFLQDLVPGCDKVTGKAVMLDEIINYVQSLQRQVKFLSVKLATMNPQLDFNTETVLPKESHESRQSLVQTVYPVESVTMPFSFAQQPQGNTLQGINNTNIETQCPIGPLESSLQWSLSMQHASLDAFSAASLLPNFLEDDLQSVVWMGFVQGQEIGFSSQSLEGQMPANHMKIEL